jgi:hypothetical protein
MGPSLSGGTNGCFVERAAQRIRFAFVQCPQLFVQILRPGFEAVRDLFDLSFLIVS